ncbi:MAG: o-succinylbenzoate synthase [Leucobacter sp.]|nr:o-succinylbenzoate synthase [Leucobacter sp.]
MAIDGLIGTAIPPLEELLDTAHVVAIPTRTRFRGITEREAVIFESPVGASEFSPFPEYGDAESSRWLAAAVEFGWGDVPHTLRDRIAVNATVPAVPAAEVPSVLARFPGCRTAKVKVAERGQMLADDVARVAAVRAALGSDAHVRVDANGGWTVAEALTALTALAAFDLDYAEQPCASVHELAELRERLAHTGVAMRIAADESVRKAEDPLAVARAGAADLLVVKAQPLGGIAAALRIISEAQLPVVVSSALDTSVGISMGLHLAAALPEGLLAGACGLGTVALLAGDVVDKPLLPEGGELPVRRTTLDAAALDRFRATPERERWWRERIERCYAELSTAG